MERLLVGKIENRITVGIVCFVVMMVLLGWAAINEGGRMASLEQTFHARSIEMGAKLFAQNCVTCHGLDGRGLANYGPGLNNPQFFGVDFFPEITAQLNTLTGEEVALTAERGAAATTDARKTEIDARLTAIKDEMATLRADRDAKVEPVAIAGYKADQFSRLGYLKWAGTQESFILTTLVHGRPTSISYWPNGAMPTWSQLGGGPLRMDQIEDLTAYILNWDKGDQWTLDDLFLVKQFAKVPVEDTGLVAEPVETVGTDVQAVLAALETVTGDAAHGDKLYHSQAKSASGTVLACSGCHIQDADSGTGPIANGTFTRITTDRMNDPLLAGYTPEQYIVESILMPGAYVVAGRSNVMLPTFGQQLTIQDLADIIAYLKTLT